MCNNDKCLKCKHLDTSDMPNLFCNLSCELVNDDDFRYCPLDPKSVSELVYRLDKELKTAQSKIKKLEAAFNDACLEIASWHDSALQDVRNRFYKEESS